VVQLLLTNGANPNLQEELSEKLHCCAFPLYIAAAAGNFELVELLLKHGADIDVTDMYGYTALHHAIEYHSCITCQSPNSDNSGYVIPVVDILRTKLMLTRKTNTAIHHCI